MTEKTREDNFSSTATLAIHPGFQSTLTIASRDVIEDKNYNPFEHRQLEHPNSTFGSILHLLKGCLGSGILAMPAAFKNSGLIAGTIGTLLAGFLCTHTVHVLVLDKYTGDYQFSIATYCALTLVPLVLISQIRNLKYLVPFSAIANGLIIVVFSITMFYMFTDLPSIKDTDREMIASPSQWPLFLSTVIFAMEGIGVVMPVENEMRNPKRFLGCPGVLNVSMVIVITLYTIFGFFGYLKWGDAVKGSVTLNLPQDSWIAETAQLLMALVMFFSYALQFYVPMEMITRMVNKRQLGRYENIVQIIIRTVLVSITVAVAAAVPNLELVIGLVGAVFLSTLGFFIPAVIETIYNWDRGLGPFKIILWKNIVICLISLFALFAGSYVAIVQLIGEMSGSKELESLHNSTHETIF